MIADVRQSVHAARRTAAIALGLLGCALAYPQPVQAAVTPTVAPDMQLKMFLISNGPNGVVKYNVTISNIGDATAPQPLTMHLALQPGFPPGSLVTSIMGGSIWVCPSAPAVSWTCTRASSTPANITYSGFILTVVVPPAGGTFTQCADVNMPSGAPVEPNYVNNKDCNTVTVPAYGPSGADLSTLKTASLGPNGVVTYTITIKNTSGTAAPLPITVNDALNAGFPAGTMFTGAGGNGGFTCPAAPSTPPWVCTSNTPLPGGASYTLIIAAKVPPAGGFVVNCATALFASTSGSPADPTPINNKGCEKNQVAPYSAFSCTGPGFVTTGNAASPLKCWSPVGSGLLTWSQANAACAAMPGGPWRLPTQAELQTLYSQYLMTNNPPWPGLTWNWVLTSTPSTTGNHVAVNLNKNSNTGGQSTPAADVTPFAYTCVKP